MLNNSLLNPQNYTHVGSYPVSNGKDLILPSRAELHDTMMIRWMTHHLSKDVNFDNLGSGLLISEIEIEGYGIIESQTFDIPASNFKIKRVQLINLDLEVPQKLTFRPQSDRVLNSVLEFYAYTGKDEPVYQTFHTEYMPSTNPVSFDSASMTAAMVAAAPAIAQQNAAASLATLQAAEAAEFAAEAAGTSIDKPYTVKAWSGDAKNHVALDSNPNMLKAQVFNRGTQRVFVAIGTPTGKQFESAVDYIDPNGSYIVPKEDRKLGLLLWSAAGKPDCQVSITQSVNLPATGN